MIQPGDYWCRLRDHALLMTKDDKPFLLLKFVVLDGNEEGEESKVTGDLRLYFTQDAMKFTVQHLRYLGFAGGRFSELDKGGKFSFAGRVVHLKAEKETYQGKDRVKWEVPYQGAAGKELSDSKRKWLDEISEKYLVGEEEASE